MAIGEEVVYVYAGMKVLFGGLLGGFLRVMCLPLPKFCESYGRSIPVSGFEIRGSIPSKKPREPLELLKRRFLQFSRSIG